MNKLNLRAAGCLISNQNAHSADNKMFTAIWIANWNSWDGDESELEVEVFYYSLELVKVLVCICLGRAGGTPILRLQSERALRSLFAMLRYWLARFWGAKSRSIELLNLVHSWQRAKIAHTQSGRVFWLIENIAKREMLFAPGELTAISWCGAI